MVARSSLFPLLLAVAASTAAAAESSSTPCYGFFGCDTNNANDNGVSENDNRDCTGFGCPDSSAASSTEEDSDVDKDVEFNTVGGCTNVAFEMAAENIDNSDVTFELVCNGAPIWSYPSATFSARTSNGKLSVKSCVFLEHACCQFSVHHEAEDDAVLDLRVDGENVMSYNSIHDPPFTTISKTFGQTCEATPEVSVTPKDIPQDVECKFGLERPLQFKITLDEHPEQISWFLVCHDPKSFESVTVFDTPRGSLAGHVGQTAEEKACIPYDTTCAFTIVDSAGDGLTMQGSGYTITLGVALLDVAYTQLSFSEKSYCIGDLCGATYQKSSPASTTTTTTIGENKDEENAPLSPSEDSELEDIGQVAEHLQEELKEEEEMTTREEKELQKLQEELERLQQKRQQEPPEDRHENKVNGFEHQWSEQEGSSSVWLAPALGAVGVALLFAGVVTYFLNANTNVNTNTNTNGSRLSSAATRVLSPMKEGMHSMDDTETDSEEDDSDTFVLDA